MLPSVLSFFFPLETLPTNLGGPPGKDRNQASTWNDEKKPKVSSTFHQRRN